MRVINRWASLGPNLASLQKLPLGIAFRSTSRETPRQRRSGELDYNWDRDYPLFARTRKGAQKSTVIQLNFELTAEEQADFKSETGISINSRLPIEVSLRERDVALTIPKQGQGDHGSKASEIASFVSARIDLLYIPAIRTGIAAVRVTEEILAERRRQVLGSDRYAALMQELEDLDAKAVEDVEKVIATTLRSFVPDAEDVKVITSGFSRGRTVDEIFINDGVSTPLSAKGDGIQSLVALGLTLEWTRSNAAPKKQLIVAVEEPESHLHPGAVHELKKVLLSLAATQQVIVTTHSQTLVNRARLAQNVIVGGRTAVAAKTLDEVRQALGVKLSDALSAAEVIVIGEGLHDEVTLTAILRAKSADIASWLDDGRLLVESAGSGSHIYQRVLAARTILTKPLVVIDGDTAGKEDVSRLIRDGVIDENDIVQAVRPRCTFSELEDLFEPNVYLPQLEAHIGFKLSTRELGILNNGHSDAWSERLETLLGNRGMPNPRGKVKVAKAIVNEAVQSAIGDGIDVIRADCEPLIDRLVQMVTRNLTNQ